MVRVLALAWTYIYIQGFRQRKQPSPKNLYSLSICVLQEIPHKYQAQGERVLHNATQQSQPLRSRPIIDPVPCEKRVFIIYVSA